MKKIVVMQPMHMYPDQIERLKKLGQVVFHNTFAKNSNEWMDRTRGFDVVCTSKLGLKDNIYKLENIFLSLPFVGVGWIDKEKLKDKNVIVTCSPGCNKEAVAEWMIGMMMDLARDFPNIIDTKKVTQDNWCDKIGLARKKVTILGKGNIGSRVGEICEALLMDVNYFDRGVNLKESIKDADFVLNALSENPGTIGLLDSKFFASLKKGCYFVTITSSTLYDVDALIREIDNGRIAGAADDCGTIIVGDSTDPYYIRLANHPKILATPHLAARTDVTCRKSYDIMIDNIESYLNGKLVNTL
ncbi:MAG: NAD(P)-dependent oxidoreductase [Candidatus Berkelbacteria bacterium]